MNHNHAQLCGSPEWAAHLQTEVLPSLVSGVDLGVEMLELGPGPGAATDWLRHRVQRLTALEVDPIAAEQLASRYARSNVTVAVGDGSDASFPDASFDSIGSFTMLHHVPTGTAQLALLSQAFRLLKPGGVLVGSDSVPSNELHHFHADDTYNPIDAARLLVQLQTLGFVDIQLAVRDVLTFTAHKPPSSGDVTASQTMGDPIEAAAATLELADPLPVEEPREGDPGGPPCSYCRVTDGEAIWSNTHWRAIARSWSPIPGGVLLLTKAHIDTLAELPRSRQKEFGVIGGAIERAILELGGAARVHLYRWGDGRAHFHVHFIPRPLGRPQFGWRNLPFLEGRFPNPGDQQLTAAAAAIGASLRRAGLPS